MHKEQAQSQLLPDAENEVKARKALSWQGHKERRFFKGHK